MAATRLPRFLVLVALMALFAAGCGEATTETSLVPEDAALDEEQQPEPEQHDPRAQAVEIVKAEAAAEVYHVNVSDTDIAK